MGDVKYRGSNQFILMAVFIFLNMNNFKYNLCNLIYSFFVAVISGWKLLKCVSSRRLSSNDLSISMVPHSLSHVQKVCQLTALRLYFACILCMVHANAVGVR